VTRKFVADGLLASNEVSGPAAGKLASKVVDKLVAELKTKGRMTFPVFGTFVVREKSLKRAVNPKIQQLVE
jgi:nucleoid DNA-binding protein